MKIDSINQRLRTLEKLKEKIINDISDEEIYIEKDLNDLRILKKGGIISTSPDVLLKKEKHTPQKSSEQKRNAQKTETQKPKTKSTNDGNQKDKVEYLKLRDKISDKDFFKSIKGLLDQMPESNGSKYYPKMKINIGIIADEFLYKSFDGVANFIYITRENYKQYKDKLDVFLVVTAWKGLNMEWKGLGNPNIRKHRNDLFKIMDFYKSNNVKVAFYSKEDPVNYDIFVEIAQKSDYIFTTCEEKINDYKRDCKNENVYLLDFGVNPTYHNPIGFRKFKKRDEVVFSGSWYNKYPHRQVDTRIIFDGILNAGKKLKIIDRNYDFKLQQYFFPEEYLPYVSPQIEHEYLQKVHKLFDWAINLNSVKNSNTMFANRVYELQALGNILLSNYSIGVNNKFPNVFLVHDKEEVKHILNGFTEEEKYKHQIYGIRRVMSKETTYQRIEELLEKLQFPHTKLIRTVGVVVKSDTEHVRKSFEKQTYPYKELVLEKDLNEEKYRQFDMITFFDDQKDYGEFYLEDMINGFKYTNCDYITKDAYYNGNSLVSGIEHEYVNTIKDKYRTVFWAQSFKLDELLSMNGEVYRENGYSIDHFEFNNVKRKINPIQKNKNYKLSVIIPTYNNGDHLLNKCFNSLKRSTIFEDMEIIIVDDGSTDNYTPTIINTINRQYDNVKTYFFNDGGSGSASRPRNKGIELSTADYITYLDPDNEAINDGYAKLYNEISNNDYDLVIGNMLKVDDKILHFDYYKTMIAFNKSEVLTGDIQDYLIKSQFKAMSIQALVCNRSLIINNNLKMVEGAVGQDTLFFHELILNSKKVKAINLEIHVYYAAVSGSTVNTISKKFFERLYLLEKERVKLFQSQGLLQQYIDKRYEYYFKNWHLKKIKSVNPDEAIDSLEILFKILSLYMDLADFKDEEILKFYGLCKQGKYKQILELYDIVI